MKEETFTTSYLEKLIIEDPKKYEVIGIVKASSDSGWTAQQEMDYAIAELKKQAAKLGANGVILLSSGEKSSEAAGFTGSSGMMYFSSVEKASTSGKAIYVIEE